MVTQAQLTAFFTNADQLGISAGTYGHLQAEGLTTFEDLKEFTTEAVKRLGESCRRPGGMIPYPNAGAEGGPSAGALMPTPPFPFSIKSQFRLES